MESRVMQRISAVPIMFAIVLAVVGALLAFAPISSAHGADIQLMYRLYNPNSGEHFYTSSIVERDNVRDAGWNYEGKGWSAPTSSSTPVYRLYSGTDHHYTTSAYERDELIKAGWRDEGIGWYSDDAKGVTLYRQFNPNVNPNAETNNSGSHNYTTSRGEHDSLVSIGWNDEGIGWYGVDTSSADIGTVIPVTHDASRASINSFKSPLSVKATGPGHPRGKYTEWYLFDRNTDTCWFYTGEGKGTGELISFDAGEGSRVSGLTVWNAYSNDLEDDPQDVVSGRYDRQGRLKRADVYADSKYVATYTFSEMDLDACILTFPAPIVSSEFTIEIRDAFSGTVSDALSLREIAYF